MLLYKKFGTEIFRKAGKSFEAEFIKKLDKLKNGTIVFTEPYELKPSYKKIANIIQPIFEAKNRE